MSLQCSSCDCETFFQQSTSFDMPIRFKTLDFSTVEKIEFIFKQHNIASAPALKTALYMRDGSGDARLDSEESKIIYIHWDREETYKFVPNSEFYIHARVWIGGATTNPPVGIAKTVMSPSLFNKNEEVGS